MSTPNTPTTSVFSPRLWGAHALMVVFVAAAVGLGVWQFDASRAHKEEQSANLVHVKPVLLHDMLGPNEALMGHQVGRPVTFTGIWLPDDTVFVDGQTHDGKVGYWAVTPVLVDGRAPRSAIYVVRGWTDDPGTAPPAPRGHVTATGWLQPPATYEGGYGSGYVADDRPSDNILPQLDTSSLVRRVDYDLYSAYVVRADHESGWPDTSVNDGSTDLASVPAPKQPQADSSTGLRNLLYALEWWVFAVFAVYVWWRYVRDVMHPAEPEDEIDGPEGPDEPEPDDAPVPEKDAQDRRVPS
ncbi:MAG: SURF1 family protein [Nocardioides sp.]|nr:SURF1 family protein [Nocardioides sp.]